MDMYGKVAVVLNQRGWKLEAKIIPKVKVDVTKFPSNGENYVHLIRNGQTLSLQYVEYEELCLVKEAMDKQLYHLDEPVPDLVSDLASDLSLATADSTTPPTSMMPTAQLPVGPPPPSYTPMPAAEGMQYANLPSYYPRRKRCPTPTPSYSASQRHHPYNKQ